MTETKNVFTALCAAQSEFGAVQKGSTNPAFKSKYADLADVASVVIPTLSSHGVAVLHYLVGPSDDRAMRTEFVHAQTQTKVWCDIPLIVDRSNMQGMKSATTYAKRIGLESLSGVAPEDDDGNEASKNPPKPRQSKPQPVGDAAFVDAHIGKIEKAEDMDALRIAFGKVNENKGNLTQEQRDRLKEAKDKRKAELEKPEVPLITDIDDEIPY